jgi:hypothetical protein
MNTRARKGAAAALALFVGLLGVAGAHEWSAGRSALAESDAAIDRGEVRRAITLARSAAEAVVPFSPYAEEGYTRLAAMARTAEQKGDLDLAAFAWRAMRSAGVATRPANAARERMAEADEGILRLARTSLSMSMSLSRAGRGADEAVIRDELSVDETPSPWVSLLVTGAALAFAAALCAVARLLRFRTFEA